VKSSLKRDKEEKLLRVLQKMSTLSGSGEGFSRTRKMAPIFCQPSFSRSPFHRNFSLEDLQAMHAHTGARIHTRKNQQCTSARDERRSQRTTLLWRDRRNIHRMNGRSMSVRACVCVWETGERGVTRGSRRPFLFQQRTRQRMPVTSRHPSFVNRC
jgi:hypothetical protein